MTPKEENFIYYTMTKKQVLEGIDYFIAHKDEDSLLEITEYLFKKVADKGFYETIIFLFDASSKWLSTKKRWTMNVRRKLTRINKDKNDKYSPQKTDTFPPKIIGASK